MKKVFSMIAVAAASFIIANKSQAQIGISINIGGPVMQAPMPMPMSNMYPPMPQNGYYFYPEINCYFDPVASLYYLFSNNCWTPYSQLPPRFAGYNFNAGRRIFYSRQQFGGFMRRGNIPGGPNMAYNGGGRGQMRSRGGFNNNRMQGYNMNQGQFQGNSGRRGGFNNPSNFSQGRGQGSMRGGQDMSFTRR